MKEKELFEKLEEIYPDYKFSFKMILNPFDFIPVTEIIIKEKSTLRTIYRGEIESIKNLKIEEIGLKKEESEKVFSLILEEVKKILEKEK